MTLGAQSTADAARSTQPSAASVADARDVATQPSRPANRSRTTLEIAAKTGFGPELIEAILREEVERGNVQQLAHGRWTLTARAQETLAPIGYLPEAILW